MARQNYKLDCSRNWTDAQRNGVLDRSGSVIVSAAAGAGKTSVLTERCVSLVVGVEAIDIDRLLVVTFTEAAAMEMRGRIRRRLVDLYEDKRWPRLVQQMALLDASSISTLHSFCLQVVRENFSVAGIEPDAGILDDDEAQLLKDDVLDRLFDGLYDSKDDRGRQFVQFIADYGQGRDDSIRGHVKHLHEYLRSLPPSQREGWKQRAVAAYGLAADGGLTPEQFERLRSALTDEIDILLEMGRVCLSVFESEIGAHKGLDSGRGVQEYVSQLREQLQTAKTAAGLKQWLEAAGNLPWTKVSRWGEVPDCCKDWAKWLYDHWDKTLGDRWLASAEAWGHGLRITGPYAELLIWLVNQFDADYSRMKRQIGKIDYSDMEEHAFWLLAGKDGKPSEIAQAYQQRYECVLVDEFQDINPIQAAILRLVSRESAEPPQPNMFTVGDVKQSIYGFRMTDPGEFLKRQELVAGGQIPGTAIQLQENFRSKAEVLGAINRIFRKLMRGDETGVQYDESAELKPGQVQQTSRTGEEDATSNSQPAVELHILDGGKAGSGEDEGTHDDGDGVDTSDGEAMLDREKEAYLIAQRIRQLVGTEYRNGDEVRKLRYRDMVILLRGTQNTAEVYANVLRRCGVPVYAELRSGYFASREIKDMLALLAVLENMRQDIPLAAVLRSPLLGEALTDAELLDIRTARHDLDFHQAVRWYAESGPDEPLRHKIATRMNMLGKWRSEATLRPLAEVVASIYKETGLLEYATLLEDGLQCRANLLSLYERARQFGQFSRQGLRRFVTFISEMIRSGREAHSPTAVSEAQDVVRIMSVHASKGLEFEVVFLADLARKFNDMDFSGSVVLDREGTLGIEARDPQRMLRSDTLVKLLAARKVRQQSRAEELRVLYVAMTRAKERLVLVGTRKKDSQAWLEEQRQMWRGWAGQLPRYLVRYAGCPLDWIVPALAARDKPDTDHLFQWGTQTQPAAPAGNDLVAVSIYSREVTDTWQMEKRAGRIGGDKVLAMLDGPAGKITSGDAAVAIARLTKEYQYAKLTAVPAITPVTELKGRLHWDDEDADNPQHAPSSQDSKNYAGTFAMPRSLRPASAGDAARQRGTATHLFLEKVDLSCPADRESLDKHLRHLVASRLLTQAEADQIDMDSVEWFLNQTDLGKALREHHKDVRREMPFVLRLEPQLLLPGGGSDDLDDAGIVRGVIDVLWCTPQGIEIADFKTDAVEGPELRRRIDLYKGQLRMYAMAIQKIWKMPVQRLWLAFLHARHIEPFGPAALRG